jgi:hypothetical protein
MHLTLEQSCEKAFAEHADLLVQCDQVLPKLREALFEVYQNLKTTKSIS